MADRLLPWYYDDAAKEIERPFYSIDYRDIIEDIIGRFTDPASELQTFGESVRHIDYKSLSREDRNKMAIREGFTNALIELINSIEVPINFGNERLRRSLSECFDSDLSSNGKTDDVLPKIEKKETDFEGQLAKDLLDDGNGLFEKLEGKVLENSAIKNQREGNSETSHMTNRKMAEDAVDTNSVSAVSQSTEATSVPSGRYEPTDKLPWGDGNRCIFTEEDEYNYDKVDNVRNFYNKEIIAITEESALEQFRDLYGVFWEENLQRTLNEERDSGGGYIQFSIAYTQWYMILERESQHLSARPFVARMKRGWREWQKDSDPDYDMEDMKKNG
ncbi:hypothetical protein BGAL_0020g00340 [Botrytis galanthina]|uniref:Uncharacterized protein n=1 Tax=Botrytis galanthina TaxID=278940 RepID=A0A4S8RAN2_9HELO|nr:hypothetical protein BGAL_0020g00340 [Botrytis galanthina]